jgi:hypothetical protein
LYCSRACSKAHYKVHKIECAFIAAGKRPFDELIEWDEEEILEITKREVQKRRTTELQLYGADVYQLVVDAKANITRNDVKQIFESFKARNLEEFTKYVETLKTEMSKGLYSVFDSFRRLVASNQVKSMNDPSVYSLIARQVAIEGYQFKSTEIAAVISAFVDALNKATEIRRGTPLAYFKNVVDSLQKKRY